MLEIKLMTSRVHSLNSATPPVPPSDLNQASLTRRQRGSYPIFIPLLFPHHTDCLHGLPRKHSINYELDARKLLSQTQEEQLWISETDLFTGYTVHTLETTLLTEGRDYYKHGLLGKSGPLAGWPRKASRGAEG